MRTKLLRCAVAVGWSTFCLLTACSTKDSAGPTADVPPEGNPSDAAIRESSSSSDSGASTSPSDSAASTSSHPMLADGGCPPGTMTCNGACLAPGESAGNCTAIVTNLTQGSLFTLTATHIYYDVTTLSTTDAVDSIWRVPKEGGKAEKVVDNLNVLSSFAVNATHFYILTGFGDKTAEGAYGGSVLRAPISGGPTEHLAMAGANPSTLAIDAQNVYWLAPSLGSTLSSKQTGSVLFRMPLGGGGPIALANGLQPHGLAVDATDVYWFDDGVIRSTSLAGSMSVPADSGTEAGGAKLVASTQDHNNVRFALDGDSVYWVGNYDGLARAKKSGGGQVEQVALPNAQAVSLAIGDTAIYIGTLSGAVMRYDRASHEVTTLATFRSFSLGKMALGADGLYVLVGLLGSGAQGNAILRFTK